MLEKIYMIIGFISLFIAMILLPLISPFYGGIAWENFGAYFGSFFLVSFLSFVLLILEMNFNKWSK